VKGERSKEKGVFGIEERERVNKSEMMRKKFNTS
jgi:hypothetical protein